MTFEVTMRTPKTSGTQRGFSLIELVVVIAVLLILLAMAVVNVMPSIRKYRADAAMNAVITQLRQGRQMAISQRRNVQINITPPNRIQIVVQYLPGETAGPAIQPVYLNDADQGVTYGSKFYNPSGVPAVTGFTNGSSTGVNFTQVNTGANFPCAMFTTTGALIGTACGANVSLVGSSNPVNAAIYMGATDIATSRAVTVLGTTGRVRGYTWDGTQWRQ